MFVIIQTDNRDRGEDAIRGVWGCYETEEEALEVNAELRAYLPEEYATHDDYPVDYSVYEVRSV